MTPSPADAPSRSSGAYTRLAGVYDGIALLGFAATWPFNVQYLLQGGSLAPTAFFGTAFANVLTTAFTLDLFIAALAFAVFAVTDARRCGVRRPGLYVLLCFCAGLAIALPLYLARREQARVRSGACP
ncbi:DUF2834 domain-containing protein [Pelomonas sp. APW6]|uniref:DUF2834 domain-containing protein n=1 Tax=Roseateles subflavus TaxID=3053353 RepID=A0ABT7LFT6_9BURK|nr:DUF2834 domain-containing protein [Pelomonas sp. APW6]MDL5030431.1 DUF2834 domain-containing protein [Pelomonas sp. APW6]